MKLIQTFRAGLSGPRGAFITLFAVGLTALTVAACASAGAQPPQVAAQPPASQPAAAPPPAAAPAPAPAPAAPAAPAASAAGKSVNDGVYTAAQARRGEGLFQDYCSICHDLGSFTGPSFVNGWPGPLDPLFDTIRSSMPDDNPGSLAPQQYADVIAYLLKVNGYPDGSTELQGSSEAMRNVRLEPKR
jgi:mono/diheme cytochrome c family protein